MSTRNHVKSGNEQRKNNVRVSITASDCTPERQKEVLNFLTDLKAAWIANEQYQCHCIDWNPVEFEAHSNDNGNGITVNFPEGSLDTSEKIVDQIENLIVNGVSADAKDYLNDIKTAGQDSDDDSTDDFGALLAMMFGDDMADDGDDDEDETELERERELVNAR